VRPAREVQASTCQQRGCCQGPVGDTHRRGPGSVCVGVLSFIPLGVLQDVWLSLLLGRTSGCIGFSLI
jgi:hypothetical protein